MKVIRRAIKLTAVVEVEVLIVPHKICSGIVELAIGYMRELHCFGQPMYAYSSCEKVQELDSKTTKQVYKGDYRSYCASEYLYSAQGTRLTHTERIADQHISYLDGYRRTLLLLHQGRLNRDLPGYDYFELLDSYSEPILSALVEGMNRYVSLLKQCRENDLLTVKGASLLAQFEAGLTEAQEDIWSDALISARG